MEENITVCGKWVNRMEKEDFLMLKQIHGEKEFGRKEKELD